MSETWPAGRVSVDLKRSLTQPPKVDHIVSSALLETDLFRAIFNRLGDAVFVVDPVGEVFIDVNERACELLGYSRSALMETGPVGVHPHEVLMWRQIVGEALRDRSVRTTELSCRTANGDLLPVEVAATAIEIEGKACVIFAVRDITVRKKMQRALQETEERYRSLVDESPDLILVHVDEIIVFANSTGPKLLGFESSANMVGRPLMDFIAPEFRGLHRERSNRVLRHGETAPAAEVELLKADGSTVNFEGIATPIKFRGESAVQVVLRDISERKRMEHERSVLAEIGVVVGSTLAIGKVYERFANLVGSLIPFDRISISEFDLANDTIRPVYLSGLQVEGWSEAVSHPSSASRLGPVIHHRQALLFDAESTARHAMENPDSAVGAAAGLTTGLAVPLNVRDQTIGVLNLSSCDPDAYGNEHLELAIRVANQIAPAVENARLYKQAGVMAAHEERNRLARDLHDSVTQTLYSLTLHSEASIRHANAGDLEQVKARLGQMGESALQALKEMRLLVYQLRPPALEDAGLISALQHRLDAVEKRSGVRTRLILDREYRLPANIENALFPVAIEALNNAIKHANASIVEMRINTVDGGIELTVGDNGRGFAVAERSAQGGVGLASMSERLSDIGGRLSVKSVVGKGTTITAFIGLDSPDSGSSGADHPDHQGASA